MCVHLLHIQIFNSKLYFFAIFFYMQIEPNISVNQSPYISSKTCHKWPLKKKTKIGFQDAGQKCCRMLQGEHSAIFSTFIHLPIVIKIFVLSILRGSFTQVLLYLIIELKTVYFAIFFYIAKYMYKCLKVTIHVCEIV